MMTLDDYQYICENISNISRIPVRLYQGKKMVYGDFQSFFQMDPASLYLEELLSIPQDTSYYITPFYQYYGILHDKDYTIIIGPTYQLPPDRQQIREFMFLLGIKQNYLEKYEQMLRNITPMPIDLFLHFLCLMHFYIKRKRIKISQIPLWDFADQKAHIFGEENITSPVTSDAQKMMAQLKQETNVMSPDYHSTQVHDTLDFEQEMLSLITAGDVNKLELLFQNTSSGQSGKMADSYLRQVKNIFITTVTLASRAAISGGIPAEKAFRLSDAYVQHCEKFNNVEQILNLQHHMVMDYATQVAHIRLGDTQSAFLRQIISYVANHINEPIKTQDVAAAMFISRSHLSTRFKNETGKSLNHYIQEQKIEKAQEYLKTSTKSVADISEHLGFSSQAYFQNVFRKSCGMTPKKYRDTYL